MLLHPLARCTTALSRSVTGINKQRHTHSVITRSSQGLQDSAQPAHEMLLDISDFEQLRAQMHAYDELRESIIKQSRDVQKLSKQAIFSLHRGNIDEATKRLAHALEAAEKMAPMISQEPTLRGGSFSSAMEEYAEAVIFKHFLQHKVLLPSNQLPMVTRDEYLGGILDFTGELNRYAVQRATQRDIPAVQMCRDLVDGLMGELLQFDLRNGALRKKYDALKYTLRKLENTLYELSLLQGGVVRKETGGEDDAPPEGGGAPDGE